MLTRLWRDVDQIVDQMLPRFWPDADKTLSRMFTRFFVHERLPIVALEIANPRSRDYMLRPITNRLKRI